MGFWAEGWQVARLWLAGPNRPALGASDGRFRRLSQRPLRRSWFREISSRRSQNHSAQEYETEGPWREHLQPPTRRERLGLDAFGARAHPRSCRLFRQSWFQETSFPQ